MSISAIEDIVTDLKQGRMVILVDEEDRENEGDLVLAADFVTAEAINFICCTPEPRYLMPRIGRGAEFSQCSTRSPGQR